jgi:hypothetical protein
MSSDLFPACGPLESYWRGASTYLGSKDARPLPHTSRIEPQTGPLLSISIVALVLLLFVIVNSLVKQEEEALERRSISERFADGVGVFAGSLAFVMLHLVLLIAWVLVNSGTISGARPFDPYPFTLLGVIVAVEAVILSSFILIASERLIGSKCYFLAARKRDRLVG